MKRIMMVLILVICILFYSIYSSSVESFQVQFAVPPSTGEDDHGSIKNLLETGSQADADSQYDVVSTEYLGDREPIPTPLVTTPPPDPICFTEDLDETHLPIWKRPCCGDVLR